MKEGVVAVDVVLDVVADGGLPPGEVSVEVGLGCIPLELVVDEVKVGEEEEEGGGGGLSIVTL